jgi:hypothetical protein
MFLIVLISFLLLISVVGILSLMYSDPDRVASHFSPYVELEELSYWG